LCIKRLNLYRRALYSSFVVRHVARLNTLSTRSSRLARHVERVESCRETSQVEFGLYSGREHHNVFFRSFIAITDKVKIQSVDLYRASQANPPNVLDALVPCKHIYPQQAPENSFGGGQVADASGLETVPGRQTSKKFRRP